MNKKVITLCAGLLLAGGITVPAFADSFSQANEDDYYEVYVNSAGAATTTNGLLSSTDARGYSFDHNASTLWKVKQIKQNGAPVGYQLINAKTGKALSVKDGDVTYDTFVETGSTQQMWFNTAADKGYNHGVSASAWYYDIVAAGPVENSVATLNAILGNGFEMQICYQPLKNSGTAVDEKKAPVAYSNLLGNVFTGKLEAKGVTNDATEFTLHRADNKQIILTNETWGNLGSSSTVDGRKFKAVTAEEKARLTAGSYEEKFSINNPVLSDGPLEVVIDGQELVVVEVNGTYYLTVASAGADKKAGYTFDYATRPKHNTYVKFGAGNVVAPKDFVKKAYYTITKKADGKVLGINKYGYAPEFLAASDAQGNMPEGMWTLEYDDLADKYTFHNRENKDVNKEFSVNALYKVDAAKGVYKLDDDEVIITTTAFDKAEAGYATLKDAKTTKYTAGVYSTLWDGTAWMTENHSKSHQIGLTTEEANASQWTVKEEVEVVLNIPTYSYFDEKGNLQSGVDSTKAMVYTLVNEYGEPLYYNAANDAYEADKTKTDRTKFLIKKDGANYNLVEVGSYTSTSSASVAGRPDYNYNQVDYFEGKVYGGDSAAKGILNQTDMYQTTENDLINIKEVDAPTYHRLAAALDTVSIYRDDNSNQLLFEDGKFLGLKNIAQFEIKPAMTAEVAYAPADYYRPEYLLSVGREGTAADTVWCNATSVHKHATLKDSLACSHTVIKPAFATGRYLVSLADAYTSAGIHDSKNPYVDVDGNARLGFVNAKLQDGKLIIPAAKPTAKDTIKVNDDKLNVAKFAFQYVDPSTKSFVIETADKDGNTKFVKWTNGVIALVSERSQADVYNMNEDETSAPTANETIATTGVAVAATNGAVVVKGAAGKAVVVTNILGQTLANTVITSDNATIAVPAGVAVVAVEGEAAVKVVVK